MLSREPLDVNGKPLMFNGFSFVLNAKQSRLALSSFTIVVHYVIAMAGKVLQKKEIKWKRSQLWLVKAWACMVT